MAAQNRVTTLTTFSVHQGFFMSQEDPTPEQLKDVYLLAITTRNFEITQLVQRNNFFMIFQGVLLAGLLQASNNGHVTHVVAFLVCLAGLLISILQFFMASGAKFWQERWEHAVEMAEGKLFPNAGPAFNADLFRIFSNPNPNAIVESRMKNKCLGWIVTRGSPSRLPIYVALIFIATWLLLWLCTFSFPFAVPSCITGFPKN